MKKIVLFSVLIGAVSLACSSGQGNDSKGGIFVDETLASRVGSQAVAPVDSGVVRIDMVYGKGTAEIRKDADQTVYLEFSSNGFTKLSAHLSSSDPQANIRFSQIVLPDGTMDGPFGQSIDYDLPADGVYRLSVHENMMAGDPWSGVFKVDIALSK